MTVEEFIQRLNNKSGNKYGFSFDKKPNFKSGDPFALNVHIKSDLYGGEEVVIIDYDFIDDLTDDGLSRDVDEVIACIISAVDNLIE